jgi:O-antigen/teichoic acid export membrane protein
VAAVIRAVRNTAILGVTFPLVILLSLVQVKILTTTFGAVLFGYYTSAAAVGALLGVVVELGLTVTLSRMVAALVARGDTAAARHLTQIALTIAAVAALALVAGAALLAPRIGRLFAAAPLPPTLVVLGVAFGAVGALRAAIGGAFYGLRDVAPPAIADLAWLAGGTALIVALRAWLTPALALALELGAQVVAVGALQFVLWRRFPPAPQTSHAAVPWREALRYAGGALVMSVLGTGMENLDKPMVGAAASAGGYASVSNFHIAGKIVYYGRRLLYLPLSAVAPEFTRLWEGTARRDAVRDLTLVTKLQLLLAILLWSLAAALARPVVEALSSAQYDDAATVLVVLAIVLPVTAAYTPSAAALRAMGYIWPTVLGDALWMGVFVGAGWTLLGRFGLLGLAAAQIAAGVVTGAYTLFITRKLLGMRLARLLPTRSVLAGLGAFGVMRLVAERARLGGVEEIAVVAPLGAVAFIVFVRLLRVIRPGERARLEQILPDGIPRTTMHLLLGAPASRTEAATPQNARAR